MARRKSFAERSGQNTRAARTLAKAISEKPVFDEDVDGNVIRRWKPEESSSYSHDDIATALRNRHAVEVEEMLQYVPPSAMKYCVTKGWLVKDPIGAFYRPTWKAQFDLKLPLTFQGRKIRFLK